MNTLPPSPPPFARRRCITFVGMKQRAFLFFLAFALAGSLARAATFNPGG
jgi:hypothetical protein